MTVINFLEARAARQGRRPPNTADEIMAAKVRRTLRMIDAALREYEGAADELERIAIQADERVSRIEIRGVE